MGSVGRPTKYNNEMQKKAERYVYEWDQRDTVPSRVGLCCFLGIDKTTSYEWERAHPAFSNTCKAIDTLQERVALNNGISGKFNSTITKLLLSNHGYSERFEQSHTSPDGSMRPPTRIEIVAGDADSKS